MHLEQLMLHNLCLKSDISWLFFSKVITKLYLLRIHSGVIANIFQELLAMSTTSAVVFSRPCRATLKWTRNVRGVCTVWQSTVQLTFRNHQLKSVSISKNSMAYRPMSHYAFIPQIKSGYLWIWEMFKLPFIIHSKLVSKSILYSIMIHDSIMEYKNNILN